MSAPQTNIEKQKRWHKAPLIGIAAVVLFGLAMLIGVFGYSVWYGDEETANEVHNADQVYERLDVAD